METDGETSSFYCASGCAVKVNPATCIRFDGKVSCWGTGRQTGATCTEGQGGGSGGNPGTGGGTGGTGGGTGGTGGGTGGTGGGTGGGSDGGGTGGNGGGSGNVPPPNPKPPDAGGTCPPGHFKSGNVCIKNPEPPNNDGACPPGSVKVGTTCVYTQPPTGGGSTGGGTGGGGGGNGDGDGEGEQSAFGGNCQAGFVCEGDAIQCAIAREQHLTNCKLLDTKNVDSFWKSAIDGTDESSATKLREKAEKVSVSTFDQQGFGWSRSCPADPVFDVVGKSFSIPFSKVCGVLGVLSMAALGLTILSCLMWVVGRKD